MKTMAIVLTAFIFMLAISNGPSHLNQSNANAKQEVFAYAKDSVDTNIQMKPLSRGDIVDRSRQEIEVTLMSYNMHRGVGKDGKLNLGAIEDVIRGSQAAIIALQEVERYSIRTGFQDQMKILSEKLEMNQVFGKSINILNGQYGNGILSKFPIEEYMVHDLPSYNEQRTVLRAVVNIGGHRIAIYNTHLGLKEFERKEQMEFIMQLISEETMDYVLMGDMNSKVQSLDIITAIMADSAEGSENYDKSTFEEGAVQERIDYIFLSPNIEVKSYDVIVSEASDHNPVISGIVVKNKR